jgi:hypothetical protein
MANNEGALMRSSNHVDHVHHGRGERPEVGALRIPAAFSGQNGDTATKAKCAVVSKSHPARLGNRLVRASGVSSSVKSIGNFHKNEDESKGTLCPCLQSGGRIQKVGSTFCNFCGEPMKGSAKVQAHAAHMHIVIYVCTHPIGFESMSNRCKREWQE